MTAQEKPTNYPALSTLVTVFFFWGFIAAGNSVFIPFCKHKFGLDQFQSQLIDFAFYFAYYVGALFLFAYGAFGGKDLVGKLGYKKSIVFGLLFSAAGAISMIFAVNANSFTGMLLGLFVVALGFSLQQTSAQPFIVSLGDEKTGATRINLGGGVNSFGTMIGPLLVAFALFGSAAASDEAIQHLPLQKVVVLYGCVCLLFIFAATLFGFSKSLPAGITEETSEPSLKALYTLGIMTLLLAGCFLPVFESYKSEEAKNIVTLEKQKTILTEQISVASDDGIKSTLNNQQLQIEQKINEIKSPLEMKRFYLLLGALAVVVFGLLATFVLAQNNPNGYGAMKFPQLVLGMLGIFMYVGTEVTIGSNLGEYLSKNFSLQSSEIAPYISVFWGSLMIGRWTGAISAFQFENKTRQILLIIVPLIAFGCILLANTIANKDMSPFYMYIIFVFALIAANFFSKDHPAKTLLLFSILGILSLLTAIFTQGTYATLALLSCGLWLSIMWPCIFSLSITGLGKYTTQGSAFLIMMILGGSILPPIQGKIADVYNINISFWLPIFGFAYIAFFSVVVQKVLNSQGIDLDIKPNATH